MPADPESRLADFIELLSNKKQTEVLSDMYQYFLARPTIIESHGRRIPFELKVGNHTIDSQVIVDSVAFGILYEQELPSKANNHPPDVVAPFGYYNVDEILDAQSKDEVRDALKFLRQNPHAWDDPFIPNEVEQASGLSRTVARPLLLSAVFGTYVEAAQLEKVTLDETVAKRIERKYT